MITDGGDQPNVVPVEASRLVFLPRSWITPRIAEMHEIGNTMAQGAAMMTGHNCHEPRSSAQRVARPLQQDDSRSRRTRTSRRSACPNGPKPIKRSRRQFSVKSRSQPNGLAIETRHPARTDKRSHRAGAPTTSATSPGTCRRSRCSYPSNIPGLPGHHWANAVAMATPIAHKGVTAGAKVQAMTMLDLLAQARRR